MADSPIDVATAAELNAATAAVDTVTSGSYSTVLTPDITETSDPTAVNLASGVAPTIEGGGHTLDGNAAYRGFFVYAGQVVIENLSLSNDLAQGGAVGGSVT